jgi:SAM-dependent methyltransferase
VSSRRYALLALPGANRIYRAAAPGLALAEVRILAAGPLGGRLDETGVAEFAGVPYLTFTLDGTSASDGSAPRPDDLAVLAHLSVHYALFELEGQLLRPVAVPPAERLDDDLVTVQKYAGKTNEQFTRLLLNVTVASSAAASRLAGGGLVVLDPLCGRGTTLNQALLTGHDAIGVEQDGKDVEAYATFLRTWLERKRLKHKATFGPVRRSGVMLGRRFEAEFAATKEQYRAGEVQRVTAVHADTLRTPDFVRPGSVDVVVADAPYGVQHASRAGAAGRTARSPVALLEQAVPVWTRTLRPGGAVGIAWNTLVAPRAELVHLLAAAGLQPLDDGPYRDLTHRVDSSIVRDVVVGRLPE